MPLFLAQKLKQYRGVRGKKGKGLLNTMVNLCSAIPRNVTFFVSNNKSQSQTIDRDMVHIVQKARVFLSSPSSKWSHHQCLLLFRIIPWIISVLDLVFVFEF